MGFKLDIYIYMHTYIHNQNLIISDIWVCLPMGYTPKIAILIRKMGINHSILGNIFSDKLIDFGVFVPWGPPKSSVDHAGHFTP